MRKKHHTWGVALIGVLFVFNLVAILFVTRVDKSLDNRDKASDNVKPLWSFVVIGDTCGDDKRMMDKLAWSVVNEAKPDMVIHVGDLCYRKYSPYPGNKIEEIQFWKVNYNTDDKKPIPMHLCVGNHDHPHNHRDIVPGLLQYQIRRLICNGEEILNIDSCIRNTKTCQIRKVAPWNPQIKEVPDYCTDIENPRHDPGSLQYSFVKGGIKFVILNDKWLICKGDNSEEDKLCRKYHKQAIDLINEDKGENLTIVFTQNPVLPNYYAMYFDGARIPYVYNVYKNELKNRDFKLIFAGDAHKFIYSIVNFKNENTYNQSVQNKGKPYNYPSMQNYVYKDSELHQLVTAGWAWGARDDGNYQRDYFWVKVFSDRIEIWRKVYSYNDNPNGVLRNGFEKHLTIPGDFSSFLDSYNLGVRVHVTCTNCDNNDFLSSKDKETLKITVGNIALKNISDTNFWTNSIKVNSNDSLKLHVDLPSGYVCLNCSKTFNVRDYLDAREIYYELKFIKTSNSGDNIDDSSDSNISSGCYINDKSYKIGEVFTFNDQICTCLGDNKVECHLNSKYSTPKITSKYQVTSTPIATIDSDSSNNLSTPTPSATATPVDSSNDNSNSNRDYIELGENHYQQSPTPQVGGQENISQQDDDKTATPTDSINQSTDDKLETNNNSNEIETNKNSLANPTDSSSIVIILSIVGAIGIIGVVTKYVVANQKW